MATPQRERPPTAAEVTALYAAAQAQIAAVAATAVQSGQLSDRRFRRARLLEVRAILADLARATAPRVVPLVTDHYREGLHLVEQRDSTLGTIDREAISVLADNLTNRLGDARVTVGRRVDDVFRRQGLREAAAQLASELPEPAAADAFRDRLLARGVSSFTDRRGREWQLETYSRMVIRTTTAEAVSHGTANRLLERGFDLVKISSHRHERDQCSDYDGRTFSLAGRTPGVPVLDRYPPFHPNCRHVMTPAPALRPV